jgi:hypothetical protein
MKQKVSRAIVSAGMLVAATLLVAAQAAAAESSTNEPPNYAIPDIAAIVMCVAALAIPCMRYRRS